MVFIQHYEVFLDDPIGSALNVDLDEKIVITRALGKSYLLDILEKRPKALIARQGFYSIDDILCSINLQQNESIFIGPPMTVGYFVLTPCERRILRLIAHNFSNLQIANKLERKVSTVNSQACSIFQKMGAQGRRHAQDLYWGHEPVIACLDN